MTSQAKLDWIPLYIHRIRASAKWTKMQDFERGWYISLLIASADSPEPGFIELTDDLYLLAGARSRSYFEEKFWTGLVGACFKRSEDGGRTFIHNPVLVEVITTQMARLKRGPLPLSLLKKSLFTDLGELNLKTQELFEFYVKTFGRNASYRLTEKRRDSCQRRLLEYMADNAVTLDLALEAAKGAMTRLTASSFHMGAGHFDWEAQFFKSKEEFQRRLDMNYGKESKNGNKRAENINTGRSNILAGLGLGDGTGAMPGRPAICLPDTASAERSEPVEASSGGIIDGED